MTEEEQVKELRNACDNYSETLNALKALAHEFLWDDNRRAPVSNGVVSIGRRLDTSPDNRICANNQVTPDLVVCTDDFAVLAEAKITLPRDAEMRWNQLAAIQKYDDDLKGWETKTEFVSTHDIVLIVHYFRGNQIRQDLEDLSTAGRFHSSRKLGLISFAIIEQSQTWLSLELIYGSLTSREKEQKLRPLAIALDHIVANPLFSHIELYDAMPPLPLLMNLVHKLIVRNLAPEEFLSLRENGEVRKEIRVPDLKSSLAETYGPGQSTQRVPEIPMTRWVRDALEMFAELGWAERHRSDVDAYVYVVKRRRNEFEQFLRHCAHRELDRKVPRPGSESQAVFPFMEEGSLTES